MRNLLWNKKCAQFVHSAVLGNSNHNQVGKCSGGTGGKGHFKYREVARSILPNGGLGFIVFDVKYKDVCNIS